LVCRGAYGVVRHPIYVGNTLSVLGIALIFRAAGALAYVLVLAALFVAIIPIEERDLRATYGEEYSAYEKKVRYRLIPRVF
jgi:protein-S-isoprenylcysteine O-methyltransferase Ste14